MSRTLLLFASLLLAAGAWGQKAPTAPDNEPRSPSTVRSPNSADDDLTIPLCPAEFHDSLAQNGIAKHNEQGVTNAKIKSTVPALITPQAIDASGKSQTGNYTVVITVVVDTKGNPQQACLEKSSGYGLDASAAKAVQQYQFDAAQKDGKPVQMRLPIAVRFISENPPDSAKPIAK